MERINQHALAGAVLLLAAILGSELSCHIGMPPLLGSLTKHVLAHSASDVFIAGHYS